MRLCVAMTGSEKLRALQWTLNSATVNWEIEYVGDGVQALEKVSTARFDALVLHGCLPRQDGYMTLEALWEMNLACPPRVLFLSEPELFRRENIRADCVAPILASPRHLARLLELLAQKKMPALARGAKALRDSLIREFLNDIELRPKLKGWAYIAWMLDMLIPSPMLGDEITTALYPSCARAFETTPAAVERCTRHAVEEVFVRGSMGGIERYFGTTVDPERGKPTNRAFLVCAAEQLREQMEVRAYSRACARAPKSMEMHHKPAAPITV